MESAEGRERTETDKGFDLYLQYKANHLKKIDNISKAIKQIYSAVQHAVDLKSIRSLTDSMNELYTEFNGVSMVYMEFLKRRSSDDSSQALESHRQLINENESLVNEAMKVLVDKTQKLTRSSKAGSRSSERSSNGSSRRSSVIAIKKAELESATVKLKIAEEETKIRKQRAMIEEQELLAKAKSVRQKADLDAELALLDQKKEAAAAKAELEALEAEDASRNLDDFNVEQEVDMENQTRKFVESISIKPSENIKQEVQYFEPMVKIEHATQPTTKQQHIKDDTFLQSNPLNVNASVFQPRNHQSINESSGNQFQGIVTDFTRYLLKKDLLLSRLSAFDDRPETFLTWKTSFQTVMQELRATPIEELDLLVKWAGPESKRHVISIKSANTNNLSEGLKRTWQRLEERYGHPEMLEVSLKRRVETFPKLTIKDNKKLYDLYDLASEIESMKCNEKMRPLLSHYDSSIGVTPLVNKLPHALQERWTSSAVKFMRDNDVAYPPFCHFVDFLRDQSRIRNNPSFHYDNLTTINRREGPIQKRTHGQAVVNVRKTETSTPKKQHNHLRNDKIDTPAICPLHNSEHSLAKCRVFKAKPIGERLRFLKENKICYKCCESALHMKKDCPKIVICKDCNSKDHPTALHVNTPVNRLSEHAPRAPSSHGGEESNVVDSNCTRICGGFRGKSCSKITLADVFLKDNPDSSIRVYVMIDDQSNRTLGSPELFNLLGVNGNERKYTIISCAGRVQTTGRQMDGLVVKSIDKSFEHELPSVIECDNLPNNRHEIPTPEVAKSYRHLHDIAEHIQPIDDSSEIMLLLGRDIVKVHHVLDQRIGPSNTPYAQKLPLGWCIIGESCLGKVHAPDELTVNKVSVLPDGRNTIFEPCTSQFNLKETELSGRPEQPMQYDHDLFKRSDDDNTPGLSVEDRKFITIMEANLKRDENGNWTSPLPFKDKKPKLRSNFEQVLKRAKNLDKSLAKDNKKREHFIEFMEGMFRNGHAERAPPLNEGEDSWYLPIFGVYHHRKKDKIRVVFDSAAKYNGLSLNDAMLSGPDLTNSLLGILMRFRKEHVAVIADIQQMFYSFRVDEDHRNYLRFLWHESNDFGKPLVEYRMCVHIFGNTASPSIATYGLRLSVENARPEVKEFVYKNFYVDDGLISVATSDEAVQLLKETQSVLQSEGNIRLHKIASNDKEVMKSFPAEDLAQNLEHLQFDNNTALPTQHSLGIRWNLNSDSFSFDVLPDEKPFSRRGILSTINSIFDPLGFLGPVILEGRLLQRELIKTTSDWDQPLPSEYQHDWSRWTNSLLDLRQLKVRRTYLSESFAKAKSKTVHIFCDASEKAVSAVGFLRSQNSYGQVEVGFLLGKSKVAPVSGHTIPRLELCAAVLATELAEIIFHQLGLPLACYKFYTDSRVVLGYINNESKRFYNYVANRVHRIRAITKPSQWAYVPSKKNPADEGTRGVIPSKMQNSAWITGPEFLRKDNEYKTEVETFELQNPDDDKEIRQEVELFKTYTSEDDIKPMSHRFHKFSHWRNLVRSISFMRHISISFTKNKGKCSGWHVCSEHRSVEALKYTEKFILHQVQREVYKNDIDCIISGKPLPKSSSVINLSPYLDSDGLLRVGGRLKNSSLKGHEKHPILIPGKHHIAILLTRHYHELSHHQGRHITEGSIRSAGFWITKGKSLVSSIINKCVKCRKLRAPFCEQKMADLPTDRLEPGPPFKNVGVDCFGPWQIVTRRTRGGQANSKRWAVLFTCLTTRAVHIEVIEELSSASFIMALKRFISIRGPVSLFRSDRGTNFVGSTDDLGIEAINVEDGKIGNFLSGHGTIWRFNPPYASHMGGVWERLIGVTRRILDAILMDHRRNSLTHEMLVTFLAEASAIINSRPLSALTVDPENPLPLSPSLLLTQKPEQTVVLEGCSKQDIYQKQWKYVYYLSERFWDRWKSEYLQILQNRRKWFNQSENIFQGDIVLLRDQQSPRHQWPMGIVEKTYPGSDNLVRTCDVRVFNNANKLVTYTRPITEVVFLLHGNQTVKQ